jgi:hypothetical protein
MATPVSRGFRRPSGVVVFGVDLKDAREEIFVRMVCDGLTLGVAYARAGFKGTEVAAHKLFHLPRIQERANAILEARRTTGVVSLPEVTDMLQRVFAGAHAKEEYSAAHNAAFSLARLYGHVTDKATLEVIRRPSRDPDAPSEQVLSDWVASLPVVSQSVVSPFVVSQTPLEALEGPGPEGSGGPLRSAPASLLGPGPLDTGITHEGPSPQLDLFNDINGLADGGRSRTGNGAPTGPVTGAPNRRARSKPLGRGKSLDPPDSYGRPKKKRVPRSKQQLPVKKREKIPSAKDLFG